MTKQNIVGPLREQSDWEQNDENRLGFIKNKPFYDNRKSEPLTIEWDGVIGDRITKPGTNDTYILVRISEEAPTFEEVQNSSFYAPDYDAALQLDSVHDLTQEGKPAVMGLVGGVVYFYSVLEDTQWEGEVVKKGIYVYRSLPEDKEKGYPTKFYFPSVTTGELKTLDEKFLPDNRVIYYATPDSENNGVLYRTSEKVDENMVTGEELKEAFENGKDIWVCIDFMEVSVYLRANSVAISDNTDTGVLEGMVGCTMLPVVGQVIQYLFTT